MKKYVALSYLCRNNIKTQSMKTTKTLRQSSFKDYIAVDVIDEQKNIVSSPFYLKKGETKQLMYKDQEESRWIKTDVKLSDDFTKLKCVDNEGLNWESELNELI